MGGVAGTLFAHLLSGECPRLERDHRAPFALLDLQIACAFRALLGLGDKFDTPICRADFGRRARDFRRRPAGALCMRM